MLRQNPAFAVWFASRVADLGRGLRPAVVVAICYVLLIGVVAVTNRYDALDFVHLGTVWSEHDRGGSWGYDGQFYYQMARDPLRASRYMDNAPFREQHMFYPLVVGILSLGQVGLIPIFLLLVNVVAVVLSVELFARLLAKAGFSPWFSLALGFYFGQVAATLFDTAEPLTYFLVCLGIWFLSAKKQSWLAALLFGLASLTREIAILFPLGYLCLFCLQKDWRRCMQFVVLGILPLLFWLLFLRLIFGQTGVTFTRPFEHIPFAGIFVHAEAPRKFPLLLLLLFLPTLAGWLMALSELVRVMCMKERPFFLRFRSSYLILLANLLMITLMSRFSYVDLVSSGRIATGVVLAVFLYGFETRQKWVLWGAQFYTSTLLIYIIGTLLHWPSFLA